MARKLDVYLFNDLVGCLVQDDGGQMVFDYAKSWLNRPGATPLSHSLPLRPKRFRSKECRGFFAGTDRRRVRGLGHLHAGGTTPAGAP